MSTKQIFRTGLMATAGLAALGLTACANSHATSNRYGSHYDFEGTSCVSDCGVSSFGHAQAQAPAFGHSQSFGHSSAGFRPAPQHALTHYDYESIPCSTGCGSSFGSGYTSGHTTGYTTGHTGYTTGHTGAYSSGVISSGSSTVTSTGYATETAPCPAGTTSQPDGTCLQAGSHFSGYTSGSTISTGLAGLPRLPLPSAARCALRGSMRGLIPLNNRTNLPGS